VKADGGTISDAVAESVPLAMFSFFDNFPAATLISGIAVVVVGLFFATSSDSASLVVDMLCAGDAEAGPTRQRVFWGLSEGALAASLIVLGGDEGLAALQQVITVIGLPIFIMVFAMMFALIVGLRRERVAVVVPAPVEEAEVEVVAPGQDAVDVGTGRRDQSVPPSGPGGAPRSHT
jgi:choline-glycine betaine transporter